MWYVVVWVVVVYYCVDVCFEFGWFEWFEYVVVGVGVQVLDLVVQFVVCGQYDYGCVVVGLVEVCEQCYFVDVWQVEVEDYEFVVVLCQCLFGKDVVMYYVDGEVSLFEVVLDIVCDGVVVFDQKELYEVCLSIMGWWFRYVDSMMLFLQGCCFV